MSLKSLCYKKSDGTVVAAMPTDHVWSDIEKGLRDYNGQFFATVILDISDIQLGIGWDGLDMNAVNIQLGKIKVDDVDNPTALVEV